jgi:hypothetical protein
VPQLALRFIGSCPGGVNPITIRLTYL